jgi:hypothetical protein
MSSPEYGGSVVRRHAYVVQRGEEKKRALQTASPQSAQKTQKTAYGRIYLRKRYFNPNFLT